MLGLIKVPAFYFLLLDIIFNFVVINKANYNLFDSMLVFLIMCAAPVYIGILLGKWYYK